MLMKKNRKWFLILTVLFVVMSVLPVTIQAQPNDPVDITDPDAPIDGGLALLIATGIGYGFKKMRDQRKSSRSKIEP